MRNILVFFCLCLSTVSMVLANSTVSLVEIIATNTIILAEPKHDASFLWKATPGHFFEFKSQTTDFVEIKLSNKKSGWVDMLSVNLLIPTASINEDSQPSDNKTVSLYTFEGQEDYRFPRRTSNLNFNVNVDGFYEIKVSGRDYDDKGHDNLQKIKNDPLYKKIPANVLQGDYKIDQRSQIKVEGKLSEDLYVHYDILQEEDMPAKYDISIEYKKHYLEFHHLNIAYKQGSFINVGKKLTGMQYKHNGDENFAQVSMGKERSETGSTGLIYGQEGVSKYKIGKTYIFPGSVNVWKNSKRQKEHKDFEFDYYAGEITFKTALSSTDYFKVSYEQSNPIADYLPVLARRNFQGFQYEKKSQVKYLTDLTFNSSQSSFTYFPPEFLSSELSFSSTYIDTIPSFNDTIYSEVVMLLISNNMLLADTTLNPEFTQFVSVNEFLDDPIIASSSSIIAAGMNLFMLDSAEHLANYLNSYSPIQLFSDEFFLIDGLTLQDSINIFELCVKFRLLNIQGYIVHNILNVNTFLPPESDYFAFDGLILSLIKQKYLDQTTSKKFRYILPHQSIVLGSESIEINDEPLQAHDDYYMDHSQGIITFHFPLSPSDNIVVDYDFYSKIPFREDLIGRNKTGAYLLSHSPVVDGSIKIFLDDKPMVEVNDYILDYDTGELFFNFSIPFPSVIDVAYHYIPSREIESMGKKQAFDYGVTYMNQFIPAEEELLTSKVSSENVTVSNNLITLENTPLINTENIKISINDVLLSTQNYYISNAYKGEITLLTTANITSSYVSYDYSKSYQTKYTLNTLDGASTLYTISEYSENSFVELPIKYNGVNYFSLFDASNGQELKLEEGEDYNIISYGEDGSYLEFEFIDTNEYSKLYNDLPGASDRLTIYYDYSPSQSDALPDIKHEMIGLTLKGNITNKWSVDGELAVAKNNISSHIIEANPVTFSGAGVANHYYNLNQKNIVENSEQIFFNNIVQTKDRDYFINYDNGTFRIKSSVPASDDEIIAHFNYYDTTNLSSGDTETSYATRLSTDYNGENVKASAAFKYIDKDFDPIGSIKESKGNTILDTDFSWKLSDTLSFSSAYSRKKLFLKENSENVDIFQHSDIFSSSVSNRLFNAIDTNHNFRYQFDLSDPENEHLGDSTHAVDNLLYSYNGTLSFGPSYFKSSTRQAFSRQISDIRDGINTTSTRTGSSAYDSTIKFSNVFILGKVHFSPKYLLSESESANSASSRESYSATSSIAPFSFLSFSPTYSFSKAKSEKSSGINSVNLAESYGTSSRFSPFKWISTSFSYNHNETESALLNQQSDLTESHSFSIQKLTPYAGIRALGFSKKHYLSNLVKDTNINYSYSGRESKIADRKKITQSDSNRVGITKLVVLPRVTLQNISYSFSNSSMDNSLVSTTSSKNYSLNENNSFSAAFSFDPTYSIFKRLDYSGNFNQQFSLSSSFVESRSVTGNQSQTETYSNTFTHSLSFKSPQIKLPFFLHKPITLRLGWFSLSANQSLLTKKNDKQVYDLLYSSVANTYNRDTLTSYVLDNQKEHQYGFKSTVSPLNLIKLSNTADFSTNYLNRNKYIDGQTTYQERESYSSSTSISPFSFLSFSTGATYSEYTQWIQPSVNVSISDLKTTDSSNLSRTNSKEITARLSSTFKPFRMFSISGGFNKRYISEDTAGNFSDDIHPFHTESYSLTLSFFPLKSMTIKGTFSDSETWTTDRALSEKGQSNKQTVSYLPHKTSHSSINIQYTRSQQFGVGLNDLNKSLNEQETGDIEQTQVVSRDNIVQTASINVAITKPINNVFVNSLVFTAEGYFKDITDSITAENSYSLSGLLAKGTLKF